MEATGGADSGGGGAGCAADVDRVGLSAETGRAGRAAGDNERFDDPDRDVESAEIFRAGGGGAVSARSGGDCEDHQGGAIRSGRHSGSATRGADRGEAAAAIE